MSEKNEVAVATPATMIELAVKSGADLEKLEKLLELQQRWEAGEARKAYMKDFASAQDEIEAVKKTARNQQTNSNYATLANVIEEAKPIYTKHNISIVFREAEAKIENCVRVHADIYHSSGHVNNSDYYVEMPIDMTGIKGTVNKTSIHAKASSITYARRYLMTMIFNIPTPDDDGNSALPKPVVDIKPPERKTKPKDANEEFFAKLVDFKNKLGMQKFKEILIKNDLKVAKMGELKNIDVSIRDDLLKELKETLEKGVK